MPYIQCFAWVSFAMVVFATIIALITCVFDDNDREFSIPAWGIIVVAILANFISLALYTITNHGK